MMNTPGGPSVPSLPPPRARSISLLQLLEKPVLARQVLGLLVVRKQSVQHVWTILLNVGEPGFTSITASASGWEKSGLSSKV
jgi:hypothetical protein